MSSGNSTIVVGVAGPLSGARAAHAPLLYRATDRLQQHGIGWRLEDDGADPAIAVAVAQRFIAQGVAAVIGHFNSACAEAVLPLYRQHGIALLLPASSQTGLGAAGGAFRLCSTDLAQAELMGEAMGAVGATADTVEIAVDGTPYARRVLSALAQAGWPAPVSTVDIDTPPAPLARLRLVLATCANALAANRILAASNWNGSVIYSDDAHVEAFFAQAATRRDLRQRVIGSHQEYGELVEAGCDLVARWRAQDAGQTVSSWLFGSGLFSPAGDKLDAGWKLYALELDD